MYPCSLVYGTCQFQYSSFLLPYLEVSDTGVPFLEVPLRGFYSKGVLLFWEPPSVSSRVLGEDRSHSKTPASAARTRSS